MQHVLPAWPRRRALNIAHRGARAFAPENTLEAIAKARRAGADMVELDVQLSSDGVPVVFHDAALTCRTDARVRFPERSPWRVSQFTAAEIGSLNAGSSFVDELRGSAGERSPHLREMTPEERQEFVQESDFVRYQAGDLRVPLLREALEYARTVGVFVNIEIKNLPWRYPNIARATVRVIREAGMAADVLVSSFDHAELREVRACDRDIATAVLTRDRLANPASYVRDFCGADALHPGCTSDSDSIGLDSLSGAIDIGMIRRLRDEGLLVNVWTENNAARMLALLDAGVTGIVTDYPNRLARVLEISGEHSDF